MVISGNYGNLDEADVQKLNTGLRTTTVIWAAFLAAQVVYLIVANVMQGVFVSDIKTDDTFAFVAYALYVISIFCLLTAYFLPKVFLKRSGAITSTVIRSASSMAGGAPASSIDAANSMYITAKILSISFCESIGIFGLILRILNTDFLSMYVLVAISAAALIYFRPRKKELYDLAVKMKQEASGKDKGPVTSA